MRLTLLVALAAALGLALPAPAQSQIDPPPSRRAWSPPADRVGARRELQHAELDVAASQQAVARAEDERQAVAERIKREGSDPNEQARVDANARQAHAALERANQVLEHRRLDVEAMEIRARMPARPTGLSIEFPGGAVSDFIAALSKSSDQPVNVIVTDPQIASAQMGPVSLRGVTVETAVRVIPSAAAPRFGHAVNWDVSRIDDEHGAPVFRLRAVDADRPHGRPIVTEVVSLAGISAAGMDAKSALSAVDAALGLIDVEGQPPEIKYHPESGLLIIRGTPSQVSTVREVVNQMSGDSERRRTQELRRASAKITSEMQIRKLQIQHERAAAQLAAAEAEYKDFVQMREAGTVSPSQMRDAELKLAEARANAELAEAEMAGAKRQAELGAAPAPGDEASDERPQGAPAGGEDPGAVIQQLRTMVEELKNQNQTLQQQVRALQADRLKKDTPEPR
jgi:type II secretory pathway component GspD/PulD (secretin)